MALMKGIDSDKKVVDVLLTAEGSLTEAARPKKKSTLTVLSLDTDTSIVLQTTTVAVDITTDLRVSNADVFMGFAAAPSVTTAAYTLAGRSRGPYGFYAHPDDALTIYFAADGAAFQTGDYIRIQEWSD